MYVLLDHVVYFNGSLNRLNLLGLGKTSRQLMKKLTELSPNEEGTISHIERVDLIGVQRLMVMGLVEGSLIKYLGAVPGGDPIEIILGNSRLALSKEYADYFFV